MDESENIQLLQQELEKIRRELNLLKFEKVSKNRENSPAAIFSWVIHSDPILPENLVDRKIR